MYLTKTFISSLILFSSIAHVFAQGLCSPALAIDSDKTPISRTSDFKSNINKIFFTTYYTEYGSELTVLGDNRGEEVMLMDIALGVASSSPEIIGELNGKILFHAENEAYGRELYVSDGTPSGTSLLKDINPGPVGSLYYPFALFNGKYYFEAYNATYGVELWVTDGTSNGTKLVKDILPGPSSSSIGPITVAQNHFYFSADDGVNGFELWKSDGTTLGTVLVEALAATSNRIYPKNLTDVGTALYFSHIDTIYKLDYTTEDITPIYGGLLKSNIVAYNGNIIYGASSSITEDNDELFVTSIATNSTSIIRVVSGSGRLSPREFNLFKNKVIFKGSGNTITGLYEYDGTSVTPIVDINPGAGIGQVAIKAVLPDVVIMSASHATLGVELWAYDGSTVYNIADMAPGLESSLSRHFNNVTIWNSSIYFSRYTEATGKEIWKTNGGPGDIQLYDASPGPMDSGDDFLIDISGLYVSGHANGKYDVIKSQRNFNSPIVFTDLDITNAGGIGQLFYHKEDDIYFSSAEGVSKLNLLTQESISLSTSGSPRNQYDNDRTFFTPFGDDLYYIQVRIEGDSYVHRELMKTDGTASGTVLLKDFNTDMSEPGADDDDISDIIVYQDKLAILARIDNGTFRLWYSDGTTSGTRFIDSLLGSPQNLVEHKGKLYFSDTQGLWESDLTPEGTKRVYSNPPQSGHAIRGLYPLNDKLLVLLVTPEEDNELYAYDGTSLTLVKNIHPGPETGILGLGYNNTILDDYLYFFGFTPNQGIELWKTNGTPLGTSIVRDINFGPASSIFTRHKLQTVNNKVIFLADDGALGEELWATDGTDAGTYLVKDLNPGPERSEVRSLQPYLDQLVGITNSGGMFLTDATAEGTLDIDINEGVTVLFITNTLEIDSSLYFVASEGHIGYELYKIDCAGSCPTSLLITQNPIISGIYQASQSLSTGSVIAPSAIVTFRAPIEITLQNNFEVGAASVLEVLMQGCNN